MHIDDSTDELDALPDEAAVIRGGRMTPERILKRALKDRDRLHGVMGVSVFAANVARMSYAELIRRAELPHPEIQKSTVGRIQAAGFSITRTFSWPHCTIDLGTEADEDAARRLIEAFDAPERAAQLGDTTNDPNGS